MKCRREVWARGAGGFISWDDLGRRVQTSRTAPKFAMSVTLSSSFSIPAGAIAQLRSAISAHSAHSARCGTQWTLAAQHGLFKRLLLPSWSPPYATNAIPLGVRQPVRPYLPTQAHMSTSQRLGASASSKSLDSVTSRNS